MSANSKIPLLPENMIIMVTMGRGSREDTKDGVNKPEGASTRNRGLENPSIEFVHSHILFTSSIFQFVVNYGRKGGLLTNIPSQKN